MMLTRRLLLASLLAAPLAARAADPDPAAIVTSIYQADDPYGAAVSLQMRSDDRRALSRSFAALWNRSDAATPKEDEPVPGFDVASNSQGLDVASADVTVERQDAKTATVVATLTSGHPYTRNSPEENVVRYDFVRENGRWKIDDVRSHIGDKEWSLRRIFTEALKR